MPLPRSIEIDGRRHFWRDLIALRRAQATPRAEQPALFELRQDCRPAGERNAAEPVHEAGAPGIGPSRPLFDRLWRVDAVRACPILVLSI